MVFNDNRGFWYKRNQVVSVSPKKSFTSLYFAMNSRPNSSQVSSYHLCEKLDQYIYSSQPQYKEQISRKATLYQWLPLTRTPSQDSSNPSQAVCPTVNKIGAPGLHIRSICCRSSTWWVLGRWKIHHRHIKPLTELSLCLRHQLSISETVNWTPSHPSGISDYCTVYP